MWALVVQARCRKHREISRHHSVGIMDIAKNFIVFLGGDIFAETRRITGNLFQSS
jgi:hypothetical protein